MCAPPPKMSSVLEPARTTSMTTVAFYVLLFALYLSLNSVLNLANRWALGLSGFTFPILLTMAHAIFSFSMLLPILSARKVDHMATLRKSWRGILVIGVLMGCNIACNNLSLVHLPLSINQVTRQSFNVEDFISFREFNCLACFTTSSVHGLNTQNPSPHSTDETCQCFLNLVTSKTQYQAKHFSKTACFCKTTVLKRTSLSWIALAE